MGVPQYSGRDAELRKWSQSLARYLSGIEGRLRSHGSATGANAVGLRNLAATVVAMGARQPMPTVNISISADLALGAGDWNKFWKVTTSGGSTLNFTLPPPSDGTFMYVVNVDGGAQSLQLKHNDGTNIVLLAVGSGWDKTTEATPV